MGRYNKFQTRQQGSHLCRAAGQTVTSDGVSGALVRGTENHRVEVEVEVKIVLL